MPTAQILTKNNSNTIRRTLESIAWFDKIMVADFGSTDDTVDICREFNAEIVRVNGTRDEVRNNVSRNISDVVLYIEPWEILAKGRNSILNCKDLMYVSILNQKTITKEIRVANKQVNFVNPVYESIKESSNVHSDVVLYSVGRNDFDDVFKSIEDWKKSNPLSSAPYYYEACTLLSIGDWKKFISKSEYYMFLENNNSMSCIMNRYYYALVNLVYLKKVRPTLQNITLCLAAKPLMAEFWCLAGDVHYHLTKQINKAKILYENAIALGSKRLKNDIWPMDISKYKSYPKTMIESCNELIGDNGDKTLYIDF